MASALSSSTDQSGWSCLSSAMVPAMCGVAIEVPEMVSDRPPGSNPDAVGVMQPPPVTQVMPDWVETMLRPGAAMSGLRRTGEPAMRGPRELNEARVSAAVAAARVALTPGSWPLIVTPSLNEIITAGMVMFGWVLSGPIRTRFGSPTTLLTMIAAMAPAACAVAALVWKVQVPRSTRAMLPATAAALVKAEQPWLATPVPAATSTMFAVCPDGLGAPLPKASGSAE